MGVPLFIIHFRVGCCLINHPIFVSLRVMFMILILFWFINFNEYLLGIIDQSDLIINWELYQTISYHYIISYHIISYHIIYPYENEHIGKCCNIYQEGYLWFMIWI